MHQMGTDATVTDRRILLRYVLQTIQSQRGSVVLPVGCTSLEDWLLDALDVPETLRLASSGGALDLTSLCTNVGSNNSSRGATPTAAVSHANGTDFGVGNGENAATSRHSTAPRLHLPADVAALNIEQQRLQETAYLIFLASCKDKASPAVLQTLRAQLEINEQRGEELAVVVAVAAKHNVRSLTSIDAHVKLLQVIPPSTFQSFRGFSTWRRGAAAVAARSLRHSAEHGWVENNDTATAANGDTNQTPTPTSSSSARRLLAAVQGHLRRLDYTEPEDYHPEEDAVAAQAMATAAGELASHCRLGLALPPGLRAQIAEQLLRGVFDPLDEGQPSMEAEELLSLLQNIVWPQLGVSPAVHTGLLAWVHFCEFHASREVGLVQAASQAARRLEGYKTANTNSTGGGSADGPLAGAVLEALSTQALGGLRDHHANLHDLQELQGMLQLLEAAEVARGRGSQLPKLLESCLTASVGAEFSRKVNAAAAAASATANSNTSSDTESISVLSQATEAIFRSECSDFAPMLLSRLPTARAIVAGELHRLFGARLLPWLVSLPSISPPALKSALAAQDLEEVLCADATRAGITLQRWDITGRLEPLIYNWAKGQLKLLEEWTGRIASNESWSGTSRNRGGAATSAVDVVKVASDAIAALFGLGIPPPAGAAMCLAEGADAVLIGYCERIVKELGGAEDCIPPAPPLTRYKKDLAEQAELADLHAHMNGISGSGGGVGTTGGGGGTNSATGTPKTRSQGSNGGEGGGGGGSSAPWLPALNVEQQGRLLSPSYESLAMRANSLKYIADSAASLAQTVVTKWHATCDGEDGDEEDEHEPEWAARLFQGAAAAAQRGIDHIFRFASIKLVCGDLRYAIFERLYLHRAETAPLSPILERVDAALGQLCSGLREDLASSAATHVCATLSSAVTHVLLDGGPWRLFTLHDVELLQNDVETLRATFHADGAGLEVDVIERLTAPLGQVLAVMAMDTGLLATVMGRARKQPLGSQRRRSAAAASGTGEGSVDAVDPDMALRVLCHRVDHAASKILKKDYKISKKLPGGVVSSVSRTLSSAFSAHGGLAVSLSPSVTGRRTL